MNDRLVRCPSCGATNRLPHATAGKKAVCGKCKTALPAGSGPVAVTDDTFASEIERSALPVLLDLWAEWCGPCHVLAPTIDQLSDELAGRVKVAKVNVDESPRTAARFGVQSIPTLLILQAGREVDRIVGVQPRQEILHRIERVLRPA